MTWNDGDIYYNPERFGASIVATIERPMLCYEFDLTVVWRRQSDGRLFVAHDNGCSCPGIFDGVRDWSDLIEVPDGAEGLKVITREAMKTAPGYWDATDEDVEALLRGEYQPKAAWVDESEASSWMADWVDFLRKLVEAIK